MIYDNAMPAAQPPQVTGNRPATETAKQPTEDLVGTVRKRLERAYTHDRGNREEGAADMRFLAGDQWPEYAKQARVNRPMLTVNKLPQFLHQVTNDIRQNAPVIKATPVDGNTDPQLAKTYDGIISDIQYRSSAKHVYATAAYHAAACGIGHWRITTQYIEDDGFDQEVAIELIPYPFSVYWDPASVKPDRSDAMWCIVVEMIPKDTFEEKYPDAQPISVDAIRSFNSANGMSSSIFWAQNDHVLIAEYWCKKPQKKTIAAFESGATADITGLDMIRLYQMQMQFGPIVQKREANGYRIEQSLVSGSEVLSGPNKWPGNHIPIIAVIGTEIPLETTTIRHGLLRNARDPQQLYNFYRSAAAEHIALSPKSPYLVTDTMIAKHKSDWDSLNTKNRTYLRYTPDPTAPGMKPDRINAPEPPQALWQEGEMATDDIKATTGIYDASLGARSNETSGVAIRRRENQGDTANFHYQDNLQRSIEQCGRVLIDLIPKIYDNERTARMLAEDGSEQFIPINKTLYDNEGQPVIVNDLNQGRFDVRVTIGPSYASKRLEAADAIVELMKALPPELAPLLADIAVRNMDIPDAQEAAKRLKAMLPQQATQDPNAPPPPPDPAQQMAEQMQQQAAQLQIAGEQAKVEETQAKTELTKVQIKGEYLENLIKQSQLHSAPMDHAERLNGLDAAHLDNALKAKQLMTPEPSQSEASKTSQ
ncbi:portal protein [Hyphomicrobium methylovorum]|uniref:portal protein n=1 Tax=Hyphomicrobium methylovorum TaxID=84 RepID=UPI0015E7BA19|nr:portal protein [Hyphomicrobium methylovorum]